MRNKKKDNFIRLYGILALVIVLSCFYKVSSADVILRIVGSSAGEVVTNRDVEIDRIVESVLFNKPLPEVKSHMDQVLLEYAIDKEAQIFALSRVSKRDIISELTKFRNQLSLKKNLSTAWKNLQVSRSELASSIRRKLRAKKFIGFKEQSSLIPITDEEALSHYQENKKDYDSVDFSGVSDQIRKTLSHKRAKDRIDQWHLDLKSKHNISRN